MRLKAVPEDFRVEERLRVALQDRGAHPVYRIWKRGLSTLELRLRLAGMLGVPPARVVFPALKDKESVAVQYATLPAQAPLRLEGEGFSAQRAGWLGRPLSPKDLAVNRFRIVARDLSRREAGQLVRGLEKVAGTGFPNYFDEQRFGSYAPGQGFLVHALLVSDWERALRLYLVVPWVGDPPVVRAFKEKAQPHWRDWQRLMDLAPKGNLRSVLTYLKDHPQAYRRATERIEPRLQTVLASAYQGWLWNRMAGALLASRCEAVAVPYVRLEMLGRALPVPLRTPFPASEESSFPLVYPLDRPVDAERSKVWDEVLKQEGIAHVRARPFPNVGLARGQRRLLVAPEEMSWTGPEADERFPGRQRVGVSFGLSPGSYATLLVRCALLMGAGV